jgi:two-component system chemotaxis response regulator CheY
MWLSRRILIADDDPDLREGVADLLEQMRVPELSFDIDAVEDGDEALARLRRQSYHLALLDHHMPRRTGLEVLASLRDETLCVPCIVISGEATDALRKLALSQGARAVLRKPVDPALLRTEVVRVFTEPPLDPAHHARLGRD